MVIRRGDIGSGPRTLQAALIALGEPIKADGVYGPRTEAAWRRAAERFDIAYTPGAVSPASLEALGMAFRAMAPANDDCVQRESGAFLWRADQMSTAETVALVSHLGLKRVYPKVMNKHGRPMFAKTMRGLVPALQAAGVQVIPWAFLDDVATESDCRTLVKIVLDLGCDGAIANMEREIVDGKTAAAKAHDASEIDDALSVLSEGLPGFIGFSSFRQRNFFPFPRAVFEKHAARVTYMAQCYNLKTDKQSRERVRKSAVSWLAWGLNVRMTLGAFPANLSKSKSFGSLPPGMYAGAEQVAKMAATNPRLDPGVDWWALEQVRDGKAGAEFRAAVRASA